MKSAKTIFLCSVLGFAALSQIASGIYAMKRILAVVFCLSLLHSGNATSVLWNEKIDFGSSSDESNHTGSFTILYDFLYDDAPMDIYNVMTFEIHDGNSSKWREIAAFNCDLARVFRVIRAEPGDVINHETASDASRIVHSNYPQDWEDLKTIRYLASRNWTLYLGIEASIGDALAEYDSNGILYSNDPKIYGWVELFVSDYTVTLGNTCLDLSGRPVVVGVRSAEPVPEPASSALALLGMALLFRRRPSRLRQTLRQAG